MFNNLYREIRNNGKLTEFIIVVINLMVHVFFQIYDAFLESESMYFKMNYVDVNDFSFQTLPEFIRHEKMLNVLNQMPRVITYLFIISVFILILRKSYIGILILNSIFLIAPVIGMEYLQSYMTNGFDCCLALYRRRKIWAFAVLVGFLFRYLWDKKKGKEYEKN